VTADPATLAAYDTRALEHADAQRAITPARLYDLMCVYFVAGGPTADVGCGAGRDVAWLDAHRYAPVGYDASSGMLALARAGRADLDFRHAALPGLHGIPDAAFTNVLCNAVLMHVPDAAVGDAVRHLVRIARPAGRLLVSYRGARGRGPREPDGRLFTALTPETVTAHFAASGARPLHADVLPDAAGRPVGWHTQVFERALP